MFSSMVSTADGARKREIFRAVSVYWLVSLASVGLNRLVLASAHAGPDDDSNVQKVDAPIFIAFFQSALTVAFYLLFGKGSQLGDTQRRAALRDILPLSFTYTLMIWANSLCLRHVDVSLFQVARPLSLVFNAILGYTILGHVTSPWALACCGVIIFGFLLGNQQMVPWDMWGIVYVLLSSATVALNSIYTAKYLPATDHDPWRLTVYKHLNACALFVPVMLVSGELPTLLNSQAVYTLRFWLLMCVVGVVGVLLHVASVEEIRVTAPLTHNVSSTAKVAVQALFMAWALGSAPTFLSIVSVATVLSGSLAYALVRRLESRARRAQLPYREEQNVRLRRRSTATSLRNTR